MAFHRNESAFYNGPEMSPIQLNSELERRLMMCGLPPQGYSVELNTYRHAHADTNPVTLLTVPAGKKFLVHAGIITNSTAGSLNASFQVDIGNGDQRAATSILPTAVTANAFGSFSPTLPLVLEEGHLLRVTGDSGLVSFFSGWMLPKEFPIKTKWLQTDSTYRTLYQVPDGVKAIPLGLNGSGSGMFTVGGSLHYLSLNNTGGAINVISRYVPAGETSAAGHQIHAQSTVANNSTAGVSSICPALVMKAGDSLMFAQSTDNAGHWVRITILELPN